MNIARVAAAIAVWAAFAVSAAAQTGALLECGITAPDSIFFDKVEYNKYLPSSFTVSAWVKNTGTAAVDSLWASLLSTNTFTLNEELTPNPRFLRVSFNPGDSISIEFQLEIKYDKSKYRQASGMDTIKISLAGRGGVRSLCYKLIWVEKEYRPINVILCPPADSIITTFVDSLNDYYPNPIIVPVTVVNVGDAPSKETRIIYPATSYLSPDSVSQQPAEYLVGTLAQNGGTVSRTFALLVVQRHGEDDTTVHLNFRVQWRGGLGDELYDTSCTFPFVIPPTRSAGFSIGCKNDIDIVFENDQYSPNPFTWKVNIENTGESKATDVRATISLPPSMWADPSTPSFYDIGTLDTGTVVTREWMLHIKPVTEPDTAVVCVTVYDRFNRMATCCDTIILPAVREPGMNAACDVFPETIFVNSETGEYQPSEFEAWVEVSNPGTEALDSVTVYMTISDPDVNPVNPVAWVQSLPGKLAPNGRSTVTWRLRPKANPKARNVPIQFRVQGKDVNDINLTCSVYIHASLIPGLECANPRTSPDDTLHYALETLKYDPLTFTASVKDTGKIVATDVYATIFLPPNIGLASGDSAIQKLDSLRVDSVWTPRWRLLPNDRAEGTLDTICVEFRSGPLRTVCCDWIFIVGIPEQATLTIPTDVVDRYNQTVTLPIKIDDATGKNINKLDLYIDYDRTKVEYVEYDTTRGLLAEDWWDVTPDPTSGRIAFHAVSDSTPLQGSGPLLYMTYRVVFGLGTDILNWSGSELRFDTLQCKVNNGTVLVDYYHGYIYVSGDCLYPLLASPDFVVSAAAPNPFNPTTVLSYSCKTDVDLELSVLDAFGRKVATLADGLHPVGDYRASFDGRALPAGVYFAVFQTPAARKTLKLVLAK